MRSYPVKLILMSCWTAFILGCIIGYLYHPQHVKVYYENVGEDPITSYLLDEIKSHNIREYLKFLTQTHRLAGTSENVEMAHKYRNLWLEQGLDDAYLVPYDVVLSNSDRSHPNKVYLFNSLTNATVFTSKHEDVPLQEGDPKKTNSAHAYVAYSPSGDVTGDPVYVNRGQYRDYAYLEEIGVDVRGKICLMTRGSYLKVKYWEENGCIGIISFMTPEECSPNGTEPSDVYPYTMWMPGTAIHRFRLNHRNYTGDISTPRYPSIGKVNRLDSEKHGYARIPIQEVGYDDAIEILKRMGGKPFNNTWNGFFNDTYNLGPGFNNENKHLSLRLVVNNENKIKTIYNVMGVIKGELEPDRYVMIGGHRDSWSLGAIDPASGGSSILEVSRVFGQLRKSGWKPRRTIIFCNWDAEEFGLIGSTEYVEEHIDLLKQRAVGYINADTCVMGTRFLPQASPSFQEMLKSATKRVLDPDDGDRSLYDRWLERDPMIGHDKQPQPARNFPDSRSDHYPFEYLAGIPSLNIQFFHDDGKYSFKSYPSYHTSYETLFYIENFIDPGFRLHKGCAQLLGVLVHTLADKAVLPYDFNFIARHIVINTEYMRNTSSPHYFTLNVSQDQESLLFESIEKFSRAAELWGNQMNLWDTEDPLVVRQVNDVMMNVLKNFIGPKDKRVYRITSLVNTHLDILLLPKRNGSIYKVEELEEQFAIEATEIALNIRNAANILETSIALISRS